MKIRQYKPEEYELIKSWWTAMNEPAPTPGMIPLTTFVLEKDDAPLASVCLYLTNCPEICYMENLSADPAKKSPERKEAVNSLVDYVATFATSLGYKKLIFFAYHEKLKTRYLDFKTIRTVQNLDSFVREL